MLLYDKAGKEYNVPHAVDAKEWIATGKYFAEKPKAKTTKQEVKQQNTLDGTTNSEN